MSATNRGATRNENDLCHVLALAERPCFTGDGRTDSIDYAWFCWDRGGFVTLEPGVHVL